MEYLFKTGLQVHSLIGIGDPIIDITAAITKEEQEKYKIPYGQSMLADESNLEFFDIMEKKKDVTYVPGGSLQNSLRVISWCLRLFETPDNTRKITMLGCTGDDEYREKIVNCLNDLKINQMLQVAKGEKTSRCAAGILDKERCLLTEIKASNSLTDEYVEQNMKEICEHDAFLIEGYYIPKKFEIIKKIVKDFKEKKKPIILTLSAVFLLKLYPEQMIEIANDATIIFCNYEEITALAGEEGKYYSDTIELAHKKLSHKRRTLVVTCGKKGVITSRYDYEQDHIDYIYQQYPKYILEDEIVDLNGAGDSFLGGFISQWMLGRSVFACAKSGNATSGVILRNVGCTFDRYKILNLED